MPCSRTQHGLTRVGLERIVVGKRMSRASYGTEARIFDVCSSLPSADRMYSFQKTNQNTIAQMPNIHRLINAPFDENSNNSMMCPGLTPLQSYVYKFNVVDASVVSTMIDLGADIDKVFPPNLHAYNILVGVFSREKCNTPGGKTLLMYILSNLKETEFQQGFRELLEILLYENYEPKFNDSEVSSCLKRYKYPFLTDGSGIYTRTGYNPCRRDPLKHARALWIPLFLSLHYSIRFCF